MRQSFGSSSFGFAPVLEASPADYYEGIHSADEQMAIADLHAIADFHLFAIERVSG